LDLGKERTEGDGRKKRGTRKEHRPTMSRKEKNTLRGKKEKKRGDIGREKPALADESYRCGKRRKREWRTITSLPKKGEGL